jgi:hypothetical protein
MERYNTQDLRAIRPMIRQKLEEDARARGMREGDQRGRPFQPQPPSQFSRQYNLAHVVGVQNGRGPPPPRHIHSHIHEGLYVGQVGNPNVRMVDKETQEVKDFNAILSRQSFMEKVAQQILDTDPRALPFNKRNIRLDPSKMFMVGTSGILGDTTLFHIFSPSDNKYAFLRRNNQGGQIALITSDNLPRLLHDINLFLQSLR